MMSSGDMLTQAKAVLAANDYGSYTIPAKGIYPHQWLWDSCFIAIGLRHYNIERSKVEIASLLQAQWKNGMLPHIILAQDAKGDRHEHSWQSWLSPLSPDHISTSGITQPPMVAEAVVRIGQVLSASQRRSWYRQVWPQLLAYHTWLYDERDPHGEGLVVQIHPWETGMDNTPPWMAELHEHLLPGWIRLIKQTHMGWVIDLLRSDTRHVPAAERTSSIEALALYDAQLRLQRKAYDIDRILNHALFAIEDLAFNCIFIRANAHLKQIATELHEDIPEMLLKRIELAGQVLEQLWDAETGQYYPRDFATHRLLMEPSCATLLPLYSGAISHERAGQLVKLLENEQLFGTSFAVPSTTVSSRWFNPSRYWQGPTWANINWLVIDGLERYRFKDHAAALRQSTLEMVSKAGCREYFNPLNGGGLGAEGFSWTAALTIDLLNH